MCADRMKLATASLTYQTAAAESPTTMHSTLINSPDGIGEAGELFVVKFLQIVHGHNTLFCRFGATLLRHQSSRSASAVF